MSDFTTITHGCWRIRTSATGDDRAAVSYLADGRSEVIAVETLADLEQLRDAITEYLGAEAMAR